MTTAIYGIDLTGSAEQWSARKRNSSVWIAAGQPDGEALRIDGLRPIQRLPGAGTPFERLVRFFAKRKGYGGVGGPFGAPREHVASSAVLWPQAGGLTAQGRPFGTGQAFVEALGLEGKGVKAYRACESFWRRRGLNLPSTLWAGPGGGAPLAVATATLLARRPGPVWPLRPGGDGAVLVEANVSAQLMAWGFPPTRHRGTSEAARQARIDILQVLASSGRLASDEVHLEACVASADALAAVVCAFAGKTIAEGRHPRRLPATARSEGWIVVDETPSAAPDGPLLGASVELDIWRHLDSLHDALAEAEEPAE